MQVASDEDVASALARLDAAHDTSEPALAADERLLVRHFLAVLVERAPGRSVEVRVPPYAAVQCVPGVRHTRGTPPAVVEMSAGVWIELSRGRVAFDSAVESGAVRASGERSDLTAYLPLTPAG